eukprot:19069-Eustigmatos_ZCMA.PRE.1
MGFGQPAACKEDVDMRAPLKLQQSSEQEQSVSALEQQQQQGPELPPLPSQPQQARGSLAR